MKVVCDIEGNGLHPTKIWCAVCKDVDTGERYVFKQTSEDPKEAQRFLKFSEQVKTWIGHNWLHYDWPALHRILGLRIEDIAANSVDTYTISKMVDFSRMGGHSLEQYGEEYGLLKSTFSDYTRYSEALVERCIQDVEINEKVYFRYLDIIQDPKWKGSILLEQRFQLVLNKMEENGFSFNTKKAKELLKDVEDKLAILDKDILKAFPPREVLIREFEPKLTKFGTISKTSVPRSLWPRISDYEPGKRYRQTEMVPFNPASHKQIIKVLNEAGWKPEIKTDTHVDLLREINRAKYTNQPIDKSLKDKLVFLQEYGWKINEHNLSTLPDTAPASARLLAKRILLESRRRTLTEWLGLVRPDTERIHGSFHGIGAWTHRMSHQKPNMANIPNATDLAGKVKLLGKEMRQLWRAPKGRLLVGVDADAIQLRVFAHLIDDAEFTKSLVEGKKENQSDSHNLNKRVLGDVCKTRAAAKRFIFALLLGGGLSQLASILEASQDETRGALERLMERYQGFTYLKKSVIPSDARRGWFLGLDQRRIPIPGQSAGERRHLAMSGYLQSGEAIVMKDAAVGWNGDPEMIEINKEFPWFFVNLVHDEYQTEVVNKMKIALRIAEIQDKYLTEAGEKFNLRCPMKGSYFNDDIKDYTIGTNWYQTH